MTEEEIFALPFDIGRHKSLRYRKAIEVMIGTDGSVHYALPSHQEFLIAKAMEQHHLTREELMAQCPTEYYGDFWSWLIPMSGGYVPAWEIGVFQYPLNRKQVAALRRLKMAGLFRGTVPQPTAS